MFMYIGIVLNESGGSVGHPFPDSLEGIPGGPEIRL